MKKQFLLAVFSALLPLLLLQNVCAVGIGSYSSLKETIDYAPNLERTFSYFMMPTSNMVQDYEITINGALANHMTPSTVLLKNVLPGQMHSFDVRLKLPAEKLSPGIHETMICVAETKASSGAIGVKTTACAVVSVRSLYPEKYIRVEGFEVPNIDIGDSLDMNVVVKSWTESNIGSVKAVIDIFGPNERGLFERKIATASTEEKPLPSNEQATLQASINTKNFESGEFKAVATVYYDGNEVNASATFKAGMRAVKLINYTKEFFRNRVNRFEIEVESRWNSPIADVYAAVSIENETLKTPTIIIPPWGTATLTTYWDTSNKKAQYYDGSIVLYFAGNSTKQDIIVKVLVNPEEIKSLITTVSITTIIVVLILLIVLMALRKSGGKGHGKAKKKN
jgi:hypothetical protein